MLGLQTCITTPSWSINMFQWDKSLPIHSKNVEEPDGACQGQRHQRTHAEFRQTFKKKKTKPNSFHLYLVTDNYNTFVISREYRVMAESHATSYVLLQVESDNKTVVWKPTYYWPKVTLWRLTEVKMTKNVTGKWIVFLTFLQTVNVRGENTMRAKKRF